MPAARDYVCKECHLEFEKFGSFEEETTCLCGAPAVWQPSFYYSSRAAQGFTPVVIHQDSAGNVRFPGSASAPAPEGFQRVELTTLQEIRKFEQAVNRDETEKLARTSAARRSYMDGQIACNREALDAGVRVHLGGDTSRPPVLMRLSEFSPKGREFHSSMREQAERRRADTSRRQGRQESGFHLDAFSQNASNRESHRDASNDWGRSGRGK